MNRSNKKETSMSKSNQKAIKDFVNTGGDLKELLSHEKLKQSFALFEKIKVFELTKKTEEEYKLKLKLAQQEINELKSILGIVESKNKVYEEHKAIYDQGRREVEELKRTLTSFQNKCDLQNKELLAMKAKYDEMYEAYTETEKVINQRVSKVERNLHMKEEEVVRLKQILYGKEDIIRKISIAYEQSKNGFEGYLDQIEYYKAKLDEYEQNNDEELVIQNKNLRQQNKQLLITLMNHLTKINKHGSINRKKKKKSGCLDTSGKKNSKTKTKSSQRRHSSKRKIRKGRIERPIALTSDRYFNNSNSLMNYKNLSSMTAINKNLINIQNYHGINNYQSFDTVVCKIVLPLTLNKNKIPNSEDLINHNMHLNQSLMHPVNYNMMLDNSISTEENKENIDNFSNPRYKHQQSAKTPQSDLCHGIDNKNRKARPKTAVCKESGISGKTRFAINNRSSQHVNNGEIELMHKDHYENQLTPS